MKHIMAGKNRLLPLPEQITPRLKVRNERADKLQKTEADIVTFRKESRLLCPFPLVQARKAKPLGMDRLYDGLLDDLRTSAILYFVNFRLTSPLFTQ